MEDFAVKPKTNKRQPKSTSKTKQLEIPIPKEYVNNNNNSNNINNNNTNEVPSLPPLPKKLKPFPANLPGQSFPLGLRNPHGSRNRDHYDVLWDFVLSLDQNPMANLHLKITLCDACKGRVEPNDTRAILPCGHTYHANCVPNEVDPQCSACLMPSTKQTHSDTQMEELTLELVDDVIAMDEDIILSELPELPELPEPLTITEIDSKKQPNKKRKKKTAKTRKSKRAKSKNTKKAAT